MRKSIAMFAALALSVMLLGGCALATHGKTVIKYEQNTEAHTGMAPSDGTYALYGLTDSTPKITYDLKANDALGFQIKAGQVISIAGDHTDTWPMGTYYWKKQ